MTTQRHTRGFTLIEVLVSFMLVILVIGIGALSLSSQSNKKKLLEPATTLKTYARRGLQKAINQRHAFAIGLAEKSFVLREAHYNPELQEDAADPRFAPLFEDPDPDAGRSVERYELDEDMRLEVRRWGEKHFKVPDGDEWVFEPSGICEPLAIRISFEDGVIEMEFNPLTAKVSDQSIVLGAENIDDY